MASQARALLLLAWARLNQVIICLIACVSLGCACASKYQIAINSVDLYTWLGVTCWRNPGDDTLMLV